MKKFYAKILRGKFETAMWFLVFALLFFGLVLSAQAKVIEKYKDAQSFQDVTLGSDFVKAYSENGNIFVKQNGSVKQITSDGSSNDSIQVYGDFVAWEGEGQQSIEDSGNRQIFLYNLSTNYKNQLTQDSHVHFLSDIKNDFVTWFAPINDSGFYQVFLYKISTGETKILSDANFNNLDPKVDNQGRAVWEERRGQDQGGNIIKFWDGEKIIPISQEGQIASAPDIFDDAIVWQQVVKEKFQIFLYDVKSGQSRQLTDEGLNVWPRISDKQVVWQYSDNEHTAQIRVFDKDTSIIKQITSDTNQNEIPYLQNNLIVWRADFSEEIGVKEDLAKEPPKDKLDQKDLLDKNQQKIQIQTSSSEESITSSTLELPTSQASSSSATTTPIDLSNTNIVGEPATSTNLTASSAPIFEIPADLTPATTSIIIDVQPAQSMSSSEATTSNIVSNLNQTTLNSVSTTPVDTTSTSQSVSTSSVPIDTIPAQIVQ